MRDEKRSARRLMLDKLRTSGLTDKDAQTLRFQALTATETQRLSKSFASLPSLLIPYTDIDGRLRNVPGSRRGYFRLRYLEVPKGFDRLVETGPSKYVQPPETGVAAYFPANLKPSWTKTLNGSDLAPLLITEGELKAAAASKLGYPTIGLGGVYSYRSARLGITFLPELESIDWRRREVFLVFDSDYRSNSQVCRALWELAELLADRGATPRLVTLPSLEEDSKTGLDDFLLEKGDIGLRSLLEEARPLTLVESLWSLNQQVVFIKNPGLVLDLNTGQKMSPALFRDSVFATRKHADWVLKPDGSVSLKSSSAAASWLQWPLRFEAESLTYEPGKSRMVEDNPDRPKFNTWPGWGIEPKRGSVKPFLTLVDHLFTGADEKTRDWFLNWCAYPLQYPGTKLFTAVVLYGLKHGTGKSFLGYTLGRIYGKNFTEITGADLHSAFNEWAECKQLVLADDVLGSNQRRDADLLKKMLTQQELRVNQKFVPSYVVQDCLNFFFTSNHPDAFFLEDDDRRFFIHEITVGPLPEEFYVDYELWLAGDGSSYLFDWFLRRDVEDFNPRAPALRTRAKAEMITDGRSDLGEWVERLKNTPDDVLRVGTKRLRSDLYTSKELLTLYDPMGVTRTTANGLSRELKRQGFRRVNDGLNLRTSAGVNRYYAVRNVKKWDNAKPSVLTQHLEKTSISFEASKEKW